MWKNICIDANPTFEFAIKAKNETKRIALTCQGIIKPKEFGTNFQSKGFLTP
jgi:hypothetical protein